jgi:hypothetical protein
MQFEIVHNKTTLKFIISPAREFIIVDKAEQAGTSCGDSDLFIRDIPVSNKNRDFRCFPRPCQYFTLDHKRFLPDPFQLLGSLQSWLLTSSLVPTQPPIWWVPGALSTGVKRLGHEADHSSPSSADVKNGGAVPPLPHMFSWHCVSFIKQRDNCPLRYLYWYKCHLHILKDLRLPLIQKIAPWFRLFNAFFFVRCIKWTHNVAVISLRLSIHQYYFQNYSTAFLTKYEIRSTCLH